MPWHPASAAVTIRRGTLGLGALDVKMERKLWGLPDGNTRLCVLQLQHRTTTTMYYLPLKGLGEEKYCTPKLAPRYSYIISIFSNHHFYTDTACSRQAVPS